MNFSPLCKYKKTSHPTSYHAVFGSKETREYGLADENGNVHELMCIPMGGGVLLAPILEKQGIITYKDYATEICSNGKLFFGRVLNSSQNITWRTSDKSKIEPTFHALIDKLISDAQVN